MCVHGRPQKLLQGGASPPPPPRASAETFARRDKPPTPPPPIIKRKWPRHRGKGHIMRKKAHLPHGEKTPIK